MKEENPVRSRGVQSVTISMRILRVVAAAGGPASLSEIALRADMPAAKIHRYLVSLIEAEMVVQRKSGSYDLGPAAASIGTAAVARIDIVNRAADTLPELVDQTGCTAMLSVFGAMGPTVVRWERSYPPLITALGVGSIMPVLQSATGRAFLAWSPARLVAPYIAEENPDISTTELDDLRADVRNAGVAGANESYIPGLYALAGPILDLQNQAEAVVTLVSTDPTLTAPEAAFRQQLKAYLGL